MGRRWPVVGTEEAVAEVLRALDDPGLGVLLLTGPAGIGKTALAQQVMDEAQAEGRSAVRIVASLGTAERPYGALGRLLELSGEVGSAPAAGPRIGLAGGDVGDGDGDGDRTGDGRLLLVVDDVPLLDPSSAVEIAGLVRRGDVVVLATVRAGHALPAAIDGLHVEGRVVTRELDALDAGRLGQAAEVALGAPLAPDALDAVFSLSGGVPLHAREVVTANVDAGRLVKVGGAAASGDAWHLRGDLLAPPTLFDLVASRFLAMDDGTRRSVEALCLIQPLTVEAATKLLSLDLLVDLERNELVTVANEANDPTVRLAHPLYEESILASLSLLRARAAAESAVATLSDGAADDADLAYRLACLRVDHGLPLPATDALAAAQRALGLLDPSRAENLLTAADDRSTESLLLLGAAVAAQGRTAEADGLLADAWDAAIDDEQRARALSRRAGNIGPGMGRFEDAVRLLEEGLPAVSDPRWRAFLEADIAYFRSWAGERSEIAVMTDGGGHASAEARANECLVGSIMAAMAGQLSVVEPLVSEGLTIVSTIERDVPHARDVLVLSRFLGLAFGGDAEGARSVADQQLHQARSASSGATGVWLSVRSLQALVDGDGPRALEQAAEAVERLILGDVAGLRPLALSVQAVAHARLGDVASSREAAAAIDPSWRDDVKVQINLTLAAGWQEVAAGRVDAGAELFVEAGRVGLNANHAPLGGIAAYDAVRIGRARAALEVLGRINGTWEGPMARTILRHAELAAASRLDGGEVDELAAIATDLPRLGLTIASVNAWSQVAESAKAQGRDHLVHRATLSMTKIRSSDTAAAIEDRPRLLTAREVEVARAASAGLTSREVAERLGLSVRTVDNHLASVYRKLGVSGRQDLASLLDHVVEAGEVRQEPFDTV